MNLVVSLVCIDSQYSGTAILTLSVPMIFTFPFHSNGMEQHHYLLNLISIVICLLMFELPGFRYILFSFLCMHFSSKLTRLC